MNNIFNYKDLGVFLKNTSIPTIKDAPKTFLGIAKQPHYENVISNIYAFFFHPDEEHGMSDLFISAFEDVIATKQEKRFYLDRDFEPLTEVGTNEGGRIDLLLDNGKQALIIENKIYHYLANDLDDYWNSVETETKLGIVLSLKQFIDCGHPNFINVTHWEFMQQVMVRLHEYSDIANPKYIVFS